MLRAYHGGFLGSPAGLELSLNYCSHKCSYCFANLKKPDRRASLGQVMGLLTDFRSRETLEARLLQLGYPVLFSNNVDPFAQTNYRQALPLIETMTALGIRVMMQFRGGKGWKDAVGILPSGGWYVSYCQQDDAIRRRIEPGAPPLSDRLAMIEYLLAAGWCVDVGINPFHPEWVPNPERLIDQLYAVGVRRLTIAPLHLSRDLQSAMTADEKGRIGLGVIGQVTHRKQKTFVAITDQANRLAEYAREKGMMTWRFMASYPTDYYDGYRQLYPATMPLLSDFVTHCHRNLPVGRVFSQGYIERFFAARLPLGVFPGMTHYVGASRHDDLKKTSIAYRSTFSELIRAAHQHEVGKWIAFRNSAFAQVHWRNYTIVDSQDRPLVAWMGYPGTEDWSVDGEEFGYDPEVPGCDPDREGIATGGVSG